MSDQKPSIRDVARVANVSAAAVSLVLKGRAGVSASTRERVWKAISDLGYLVPAATTSTAKPQAVGLLIEKSPMPIILDIFYGEVITGFQTEAQRLGYQVVLHMFDRTAENLDAVRSSMAKQVRGLVVANDGDISAEMVMQLGAANLPIVLIESYVPDQQIPCIIGDNFTAGYAVMRHLLDLGHRKIALLPGMPKYSSLDDRIKGCFAAAGQADLLIRREWLPPAILDHPRNGYLQMQALLRLQDRPTAVVAVHDRSAIGALEAIREAGLRIPEDIAIASIDDVAESAYTQPPLTSFRIPRYEMGVLAMQKLNRLVNGEPEVAVKSIVYGELIVRQSTMGAD